ncbi:DUF3467 domain-containing protein [Bacillus subtilis]|uniref:DUF3467 domain-containing protein n=1 Tax=Bacillus subtilis TaxID=1423 RepID=UPI001389537D|nr:DUF3467 domain-containing protein [Bacillus subtilis]NDK00574.1 hypothetical protein [Bacillus subtilis subsp. subtilis]
MEENKKEIEKFEVYCNSANINMGIHDFVLSFSQDTVDGAVKLGNVTMSPQHAKALSQVLSKYIDQYESVFGIIPTPPTQDKLEQLRKDGVVVEKRGKLERNAENK